MNEIPPVPRPFADSVVAYAQAGWPCVLPVPPTEKFDPGADPVPRPVALYRHVDRNGYLLYVGITLDPALRWQQHLQTAIWARSVATTYVQWHKDRASAAKWERMAIRNEEPIFNTVHAKRSRGGVDRRVRYLRAGVGEGWRRVPCRAVTGEFCVVCGPDREAYEAHTWEKSVRELRSRGAIA